MRRLISFILLVVACAAPARAAPEPSFGPIPEWVESVAIPEPSPALADRPGQQLLLTVQNRFQSELHESFVRYAVRIQNSQGLSEGGNVVIPWQPESGDVVVHHVRILRGATTIDLLGNGQRFTVLRRENNLEAAMLDGVLTAVLQPEGLAVGDTLEVAFTIRRRPAAIPLRADSLMAAMHGSPSRRTFVRDIWPESMPMRWETAPALGRARSRTGRWGRELVLDLTDMEGQRLPEDAPRHYYFAQSHQLSGWRDWSEIASFFAPLYARAAALAPDSPLRREIERIAAASSDPAARAMAALRLVQEDIRYLALSMGDGGYVPASADQTWARRFGDCKGKTAVLLALLAGLGIEAEPMAVSTVHGEGLAGRLPSVALFDHVLVRARIGGRAYILDGTRMGDRDLDALASSPFGRGLALKASGGDLEPLPWSPPARPLHETAITYDGSAGVAAPVPTRSEYTYRGDSAVFWRLAAARAGVAELERQFLETVRGEGDEEEAAEVKYRENQDGSITFVVTGRTTLDWERAPASSGYRIGVGGLPDAHPAGVGEAAADRRLPFDLPPTHTVTTETLILPAGGAGFSAEGADFERDVAGARVGRNVRLENGRLVARSWFRFTARELSPADARAAKSAIEALREETAWLRAPAAFRPADSAAAAARPGPAMSAERRRAVEHVDRGFALMNEAKYETAIAEMDRAIALAPDWSRPHANRAIALIHRNRIDDAERSLQAAARLDDRDFVVQQGLGLLALSRNRPEEALPALTRALELDPGNPATHGMRATALMRLGRHEEVLADLREIAARKPEEALPLIEQARVLAFLGRTDEAAPLLVRAGALARNDPHLHFLRAMLLKRIGRQGEAAQAFAASMAGIDGDRRLDPMDAQRVRIGLLVETGRHAEALRLADAALRRQSDHVVMLMTRCEVRLHAGTDLPLALRDCNRALEYDSGRSDATKTRGRLHLRMGDHARALRDFEQVLAWSAQDPEALYGRGLARLAAGDRAGGEADVAAARRRYFDVAAGFEALGLRP